MQRRELLKQAGLTGFAAGVAGCTGEPDTEPSPTQPQETEPPGDTPTQTVEEGSWPPPRQTVDFISPGAPGDTRYTLASVWSTTTKKYFPGDIRTSITPVPGVGGILAYNKGFRAPPDGGTTVVGDILEMAFSYIKADSARFDPRDYWQFCAYLRKARSLQINHRTTDVTDHWQWDYDTIVEQAPDLKFAATALTHNMVKNLWEEFEPRLSPGDIEMVNFPSGGDSRACIQRGECDAYLGGFGPNFAREDFYKTQLVFNTDAFPTHLERQKKSIEQRTPGKEGLFIHETSLDKEKADLMTKLTLDTIYAHLPPEVPQSIKDIFVDTFKQAAQDSETETGIAETLGNPTLNFLGTVDPETMNESVSDQIDLLEEYEEFVPDV